MITKRFAIGFSAGLLIFLTINLLAAHLDSDCGLLAVLGRDAPWHRPPGQVCADDIARAGWPLQFYEEGGIAYHSNFNLLFLLTNIAIGACFSVIAGWIHSRSKKPLLK